MKRIIIAAALVLAIIPFAAVAQGISNPGVVGPSSATSGHIATYNGTSGKIIQDGGVVPTSSPCSAFGTATGTCAEGGVISAGGPTGAATTVPVITYNAAGQLTAVTTASTGVTTVGTAAVGQIPGTTTNDDAADGKVGEYLSATGNNVSLVTETSKTCASVSLTAGDWDVTGVNEIAGASGTSQTSANTSLSTTTNVVDTSKDRISYLNGVTQVTPDNTLIVPSARFTVASTTPVYIVGTAIFTVSAMAMNCSIHARRMR